MNRSTLAAIAALLVVVFLIGASWAGHAAASILQQSEPLDINVWLNPSGFVTIDSLMDDVYGNLTLLEESTCEVPQTLPPGESYTCSFSAGVSTTDAGPLTNFVIASGARVDNNGPVSASGGATMTVTDVPPVVGVSETSAPSSVQEPGGTVTYEVRVINNGLEPVTLNSLVDNVYGDLNGQGTCSVPQAIPAEASYECSFTAEVSGIAGEQKVDVVTAMIADDEANTVAVTDGTIVTVSNVELPIAISKTADPASVSEPGGTVTFQAHITNSSVVTVTLNSLVDDVYGDLNGQGSCSVPQTVAAEASYECAFTAEISGNAGDRPVDAVMATLTDEEANTVEIADSATVAIADTAFPLLVTKTAVPASVWEPGGVVDFTVVMKNNSIVDSVSINSLVDDVYGNLALLEGSTCQVPQTLDPGASYTCSFSVEVSGSAGDYLTDIVTASGSDSNSNPVIASGGSTVTVVDPSSPLMVAKTANPASLAEPGGTVEFTVVVKNTNTRTSAKPMRRLDPAVSKARIVIESDLRNTSDPNQFSVRVVDATGITVFESRVLTLDYGHHAKLVEVSGKRVFEGYISHVQSEKQEFTDAVANAASKASGDDPNPSQVRTAIEEALGVGNRLGDGLERLRAFDLSQDDGADSAFSAAETAIGTVSDRGNEALDLLKVDPINWEDVRAKLQAMQTAANDAATQIDTGLAAVNASADRSFPPTSVAGRCNQNTVQLRVAGSDSVSDDFWWTVGTPGAPARLANSEQPTAEGQLRALRAQMYATSVSVAGVPHSAVVEALALDGLCVPVPGVTVNFSTPAGSIVAVQTPQVTTDANGVALATINATGEIGNGTATVNATVDSVTASVGLTVIGPPALLSLRLGGSEVERIPNYGVESTAQVGAVVKDANGNDVADGTPVQFSINPPDHSFNDSGQVTTADGQASATLVFGFATGAYTIGAQSGSTQDVQEIRVVGNPSQIQVEPDRDLVKVNTLNVDNRTIQLTVTVKDSEGQWAPDGTLVEFEFVNPDDADWAFFNFQPDNLGRYRKPIINGQTLAPLVGSPTNLANPDHQMLAGQREVVVRATATYSVSGEERASVSHDVTVVLQGQMLFLPLIRK